MALPSALKRSFSRDEVCRVLGISQRQLRSWARQDLVPATDLFTSDDLSALRNLIRMRESRVPSSRVRGAIASLRDRYVLGDYPLRDVQFQTEGRRLIVRIDGSRLEPFSGQLLFEFDPPKLEEFTSNRGERESASDARRKWEAEMHFQKALDLETAGASPREVIPVYEQALAHDPDLAPAHLNLGTLYFQARSYKKARAHYEEALRVEPEYPLAHYNIGNLYDETGEREKAIHHYAEAARLDPAYPDVHYNLALLYQTTGQPLRALFHWKAYLRLDPTSAWADIARRQMAAIKKNTVLHGLREVPPPGQTG